MFVDDNNNINDGWTNSWTFHVFVSRWYNINDNSDTFSRSGKHEIKRSDKLTLWVDEWGSVYVFLCLRRSCVNSPMLAFFHKVSVHLWKTHRVTALLLARGRYIIVLFLRARRNSLVERISYNSVPLACISPFIIIYRSPRSRHNLSHCPRLPQTERNGSANQDAAPWVQKKTSRVCCQNSQTQRSRRFPQHVAARSSIFNCIYPFIWTQPSIHIYIYTALEIYIHVPLAHSSIPSGSEDFGTATIKPCEYNENFN